MKQNVLEQKLKLEQWRKERDHLSGKALIKFNNKLSSLQQRIQSKETQILVSEL